jgi:lipoprotein-anchoring transpeptidase ErfK/SrfK
VQNNHSIPHIRPTVSRLALGAGLGLAITAVSALPANAFFTLSSGPRPARPVMLAPATPAPAAVPAPSRPKPVNVRPKKDPNAGLPNALAPKAKGPLTVVVSLDRQELTLYAGGEEIARSRVSTGKAGHSTPAGVYSVIEKDRWHWSNLYDNAPMHYMHRITWSGLALHQGIVPNYPASHGCIRLPQSFARQLFGVTRMGARVIITRGEAAPADIAHAALFGPANPRAPSPMLIGDELRKAHPTWLKTAMLGSTLPLLVAQTDARLTDPAVDTPQAKPLKPGPVSVFVSRKDRKLYVRKGFAPVLDAPVTIARADEPIGTHVFTALAVEDGNVRWSVISVPSSAKAPRLDAGAALDRLGIPDDVRARISELMSAGASMIVSDHGLGTETGRGTDFIVQTR